jgi:AraC family transcriptional regulator, transcriptional activator of pobA
MTTPRVYPRPLSKGIKHYELYGESQASARTATWTNSFHFERIPDRSSHFNWEIEPHVHDSFLQIFWLIEGSGEITLNGITSTLTSPMLIVIPAQNVHSFRFAKNTDGPVITAAQQPLESLAQSLMPELVDMLAKPYLIRLGQDPSSDAALHNLLTSMEHEWRSHSFGHAAAGLCLLATLLLHAHRGVGANSPADHIQLTRAHVVVDKFKRLVNEQFKSSQSVASYANRIGVSAGQLTRLTKQLLGITALEVINARILFEAERELTYTLDSIKQIAAKLGFDDEAYFSRFFKKQTGQSPKAFRQRSASKIN